MAFETNAPGFERKAARDHSSEVLFSVTVSTIECFKHINPLRSVISEIIMRNVRQSRVRTAVVSMRESN